MIKFKLTEEHIKLLREGNVGWFNCEFGAPFMDPKRPYGNSYVLGDIARIVDMDLFKDEYGEEHFTKEQSDYAVNLHRETETALQIILATGEFTPGDYEADDYSRNWSIKSEEE